MSAENRVRPWRRALLTVGIVSGGAGIIDTAIQNNSFSELKPQREPVPVSTVVGYSHEEQNSDYSPRDIADTTAIVLGVLSSGAYLVLTNFRQNKPDS